MSWVLAGPGDRHYPGARRPGCLLRAGDRGGHGGVGLGGGWGTGGCQCLGCDPRAVPAVILGVPIILGEILGLSQGASDLGVILGCQ